MGAACKAKHLLSTGVPSAACRAHDETQDAKEYGQDDCKICGNNKSNVQI
jgi:DUF971 family protein